MTSAFPSQSILLIDKPSGMTSHDVVNQIRIQTGEQTVGHAGTLDPLATGLLIILVGRNATKRQPEFLKLDKEYECSAQLGWVSDTYDADGQLTKNADWSTLSKMTREELEKICSEFMGKISQQVPAYSAVKFHGRELYKLARKGRVKSDQLPSREVEIFALEILDFQKNAEKETCFFACRIHCSSGTYIRSLIHEIGQKLGVGAVVSELRRTKIGDFSIEDARALTESADTRSTNRAKSDIAHLAN